jgi:RNA polymerase sigma-70 factor (ECF subfamily)
VTFAPALNDGVQTVDTALMAVADAPAAAREEPFARVLLQARAGSAPACRDLYEVAAGPVYGYLRAHRADDPEDLTSEVFLRVFTHLDDFAGDEEGFRRWVFTITRRALIDDKRREHRRLTTVELVDREPAALHGDTEDDAMRRVEEHEVSRLLDALTPDQRDVITLRIIADLPTEDVAEILGKRQGTVKALQHRGLAALRRRLAEADS